MEEPKLTLRKRFLRRWLPIIVSLAALIIYLGRSKLFGWPDLSHQWG